MPTVTTKSNHIWSLPDLKNWYKSCWDLYFSDRLCCSASVIVMEVGSKVEISPPPPVQQHAQDRRVDTRGRQRARLGPRCEYEVPRLRNVMKLTQCASIFAQTGVFSIQMPDGSTFAPVERDKLFGQANILLLIYESQPKNLLNELGYNFPSENQRLSRYKLKPIVLKYR